MTTTSDIIAPFPASVKHFFSESENSGSIIFDSVCFTGAKNQQLMLY